MAQMNKTYQNAKAIVQGENNYLFSYNGHLTCVIAQLDRTRTEDFDLKILVVTQLRTAILGLEKKEPEAKLGVLLFVIHLLSYRSDEKPGKSEGEPVWEAVFSLVKSVSEVLLTSLPDFWKISKNFMDGKYKKVWSTSG
jgi:exocyst complex component 2